MNEQYEPGKLVEIRRVSEDDPNLDWAEVKPTGFTLEDINNLVEAARKLKSYATVPELQDIQAEIMKALEPFG